MEQRIKEVMASVFGIEASSINEKSSPDTIANWDSLLHMNLIVALEEEFELQFSDEIIPTLWSFDAIEKQIKKEFDI